MLTRFTLIASFLIIYACASGVRADFQVTGAITSINGTTISGTSYTDPYSNVLNLLPDYSATAQALTVPTVGFTDSLVGGNFHDGADQVTATFQIINPTTGDSVTFFENETFTYETLQYQGNIIALSIPKLTASGSLNISRPFTLDGVTFQEPSTTVSSMAYTSQIAKLSINFQVVPEPSSCAMCGIAGVIGLAMTRLRRRFLAVRAAEPA